MDWDSVAADDVIEALREVEPSTRSRSLAEFFSKFAGHGQIIKSRLLTRNLTSLHIFSSHPESCLSIEFPQLASFQLFCKRWKSSYETISLRERCTRISLSCTLSSRLRRSSRRLTSVT